jgi:outer membrane protein assembly factor BamB
VSTISADRNSGLFQIVWEQRRGTQYNGFIVAPHLLLAPGQAVVTGRSGAFLAALTIPDGAEIWRESLPAPVVNGGLAMDHFARTFVSLVDGRVLCFAAAD